MKDIRIILITLGLVVIGFLLFGNKEEKTLNNFTTPSTSEVDTFREGYMDGCMEGSEGTSLFWQEYCSCTYDYLDARLTDDQFVDLSINYAKTGAEPQILDDAVDSCLE